MTIVYEGSKEKLARARKQLRLARKAVAGRTFERDKALAGEAFMSSAYRKMSDKHAALVAELNETLAKLATRDLELDARRTELAAATAALRASEESYRGELDARLKAEAKKDEWKAYAVELALSLHAVDGVVAGRVDDVSVAARLLVEAAKKKPIPSDPAWNWTMMVGLAAMAYWAMSKFGKSKDGESPAVCSAPSPGASK